MVPKDGTSLYYFALADTNKDEKVSKGEVREFFQRSGWTESAIENIAVDDFEGEDETWNSEGFNKWFQSKVSMDLGMNLLKFIYAIMLIRSWTRISLWRTSKRTTRTVTAPSLTTST